MLFIAEVYKPRYLVAVRLVQGGWLSMRVYSQEGGVHVLLRRSSNVIGTSLATAFLFYLELCMFSCNITGTWLNSNGLIDMVCVQFDFFCALPDMRSNLGNSQLNVHI